MLRAHPSLGGTRPALPRFFIPVVWAELSQMALPRNRNGNTSAGGVTTGGAVSSERLLLTPSDIGPNVISLRRRMFRNISSTRLQSSGSGSLLRLSVPRIVRSIVLTSTGRGHLQGSGEREATYTLRGKPALSSSWRCSAQMHMPTTRARASIKRALAKRSRFRPAGGRTTRNSRSPTRGQAPPKP